jgi:hypothetical protein
MKRSAEWQPFNRRPSPPSAEHRSVKSFDFKDVTDSAGSAVIHDVVRFQPFVLALSYHPDTRPQVPGQSQQYQYVRVK